MLKWRFFNVLLLLLFSTSILAQKEGYTLYEKSSPDDPIKVLKKQETGSNRILSFLQFSPKQKGGEEIIRPTGKYSISPNGLFVSRLEYGHNGYSDLKSRFVRVFNQYGNTIAHFPVAPLDGIALANDGRVAIYGKKSTSEVAFDSYLFLYNKDGALHTCLEQVFGLEHTAKFGKDGTLAFLVNTNKGINIRCRNALFIFNKQFQLIKKHLFEDWPSIQIPNSDDYVYFRFREIFFTKNGNIKISLSYGRYKFDKNHRDFYLFNKKGKLKGSR